MLTAKEYTFICVTCINWCPKDKQAPDVHKNVLEIVGVTKSKKDPS